MAAALQISLARTGLCFTQPETKICWQNAYCGPRAPTISSQIPTLPLRVLPRVEHGSETQEMSVYNPLYQRRKECKTFSTSPVPPFPSQTWVLSPT